jgi:hypothetical protein
MILAREFGTEAEFLAHWPKAVDALKRLHDDLILPDYRYELAHDALEWTKGAAPNEIEKALRRFWQLDERFSGDIIGGERGDFRWSAYSLVYIGTDVRIVSDLLDVFLPLLGPFAVRQFGEVFARKVCSTFMDDVGHLLWDIQDCRPPEVDEFFHWSGHLNDFSDAQVAVLLSKAGLSPLENRAFPPSDVMRVFCPAVHHACVTQNYRRDLAAFYERTNDVRRPRGA